MTTRFRTDAQVALPALAAHAQGCGCALHARRRLGGALLGAGLLSALPLGAQAQQDAECKRSKLAGLAPADQIEASANQQYQQMLQQAQGQRALAPTSNEQLQRLRYIAERIIPFTEGCNPRARQWKWEVNLIGSTELNAFCMPGGKIAFYIGILDKLKLSDDEVAMIMGHEVAHALLEHARERMGKNMATRGVLEIGAALFGLGDLGRMAAGAGAQFLTLKFSRDDESEADALGLILAARAGYNPAAGVTLWQKMMQASKGAPPKFLSTHPPGADRIADIEGRLPRVDPMYRTAAKPDRRFNPPTGRA